MRGEFLSQAAQAFGAAPEKHETAGQILERLAPGLHEGLRKLIPNIEEPEKVRVSRCSGIRLRFHLPTEKKDAPAPGEVFLDLSDPKKICVDTLIGDTGLSIPIAAPHDVNKVLSRLESMLGDMKAGIRTGMNARLTQGRNPAGLVH